MGMEVNLIKLLILEDDAGDSRRLSSFCERYARENGYEIDTQVFASPDELPEDADGCDAALLDIMIDGAPAGVEIARRLRMGRWDGALVFITSSTDFYPEGFEVGAAHYLVKPLAWDNFCSAMERVMEKTGFPGKTLILPVPRGEVAISERNILFAEVYDHDTLIHTVGGTLNITMPLRELEMLFSKAFTRCFRSYVVNMIHIDRIEEGDLILSGGEKIPVSRRSRMEIQSRYMEYRNKKIGEGTK